MDFYKISINPDLEALQLLLLASELLLGGLDGGDAVSVRGHRHQAPQLVAGQGLSQGTMN